MCQVNLRSFSGSPVAGGAENDLRLTLHTLGPHTIPKVEPYTFWSGTRESLTNLHVRSCTVFLAIHSARFCTVPKDPITSAQGAPRV